MLVQDYLTLGLVRFKPPEEWSYTQYGLLFVFPKGGVGKLVSAQQSQPLDSGDVLVIGGAIGGKLVARDKVDLVFANFSVGFDNLLPLFATTEIPLLQDVSDAF